MDFALRRTLMFEIKFGVFCLCLSQGIDTSLVNRPSGDLNVQVKELENCLGDAESEPSFEAQKLQLSSFEQQKQP